MGRAARVTFFIILVAAIALPGAVAAAPASAAAAPGTFVWTEPVDPTGGFDDLSFCALGPGRTVYAGGGQGWPDAVDILVVKYTSTGARAWSATWPGPDGLADECRDMAVDAQGNVYLCGSTHRTDGTTDSILLKYDSGGHLEWAVIYGPAGASDEARAMGLDADGRVYVAGESYRDATGTDVYVARFRASDGARRWTARYRTDGYEYVNGMAVTSRGSSYVIGESGPIGHKGDALLLKVTAAGKRAWVRRWTSRGDRMDNWEQVALRGDGGVCVAGETDYLGAGNLSTARYSAAGKLLWAHTWGAANGHRDMPTAIAVDRDGNAWVAGYSRLSDTAWQTLLVKWRPTGGLRFSRVMGSATVPMRLHDVVTDANGNAYAVGTWNRIGPGGFNLMAVKYSPAGKRIWRSYKDGSGSDDMLSSVALGGPTSLYACGAMNTNLPDTQAVVTRIAR